MQNTFKTAGIILIVLGVMTIFNILVDLAFWRILVGILVLGVGFFLVFKKPEDQPESTASKEFPEEHSRIMCEACNSALPEGSAYCSKCGGKL